MFGSGIPTAEKPTAKKFYLMSHGPNAENPSSEAWMQYKAHLRKTSILIPLPPALYNPLPAIVKQTLLLDFPMYRFHEATDGAAAVEEAQN